MDSDNELTKPVTKKGAKAKEATPVTEAYAVTNHKLKKPTAKQLKELKKIALQEIQAEINGTPTEEVSTDEEPEPEPAKPIKQSKKASPAPASVPTPTVGKKAPKKQPTPTPKPKKQLPPVEPTYEESDTESEQSDATEVEEEIIVVKKPKKEKKEKKEKPKKKKKIIRKIVMEESSDDDVTDSETDSDPEPPKRHTRETKSQQHRKTKIAVAKPVSPYYFA